MAEPRKLFDRLIESSGLKAGQRGEIPQLLWQRGVANSSEFQRIVNLPRRVVDLETVPDLTPLYQIEASDCKGCDLCANGPPKLWSLQSLALLEAEATGGLLGALPVGSGKTLISLLLPDAMQAKMAVLLVPPSVRDQLIKTDIPKLSRHFRLPLERLRVVAYSQLQTASSAHVLDEINPDVIIADEAHYLKNKTASRTKRFLWFMKDHPRTRVCPLSGTMTTKSIKDYAHLSNAALRFGSPVPMQKQVVEEWAAALDVRTDEDEPMPPGSLLDLCNATERAHSDSTHAARLGFSRRLRETPGVVASQGEELGVSLYMGAIRSSKSTEPAQRKIEVPGTVMMHLTHLRNLWEIGGEEIDDPLELARFARQLAFGFYYVWDWTFKGKVPEGKPDQEWLTARAAWHKAVRDFLMYRAKPGLDSPMLVTNATRRGEIPHLTAVWEEWSAVSDREQPPTNPVWVDDFVIRDAEKWAQERLRKKERGIIWFEHRAVEAALAQVPGLPVYGAGTRPETSVEPVIACSVKSHGTGKNMQHWNQNLFAIAPANATTWQQAIARTHRNGQQEDEVHCEVYLHTEELSTAFYRSVTGARYVEATTKERQRLLFATRIGW